MTTNKKNESKINLEGMFPKEEEEKESLKETPKVKPEEDKTEEEILKLKNELLIALAETENLRKRHAKEREDLTKFAMSSALSELSSPFENLFTALKFELPEDLKENKFVKSVLEGVLMVQKDFEKIFAKLGLKRIFPEGEKFDPNMHQAVAQVEVKDFESGMVVQVVSAGFNLNGRVLKPAMVVVAK